MRDDPANSFSRDSMTGFLLRWIAAFVLPVSAFSRIGAFGMIMVLAIAAATVWVLEDYGLLTLKNTWQLVWLARAVLSGVPGIGPSRSHLRRRLSGQAGMDDVDE